ncbi:MAG: hypothetical protein OEV28_04740, partial [Nitrospirota bacterium]|nr:hypothetical protein [Nitrospirota bacterium]
SLHSTSRLFLADIGRQVYGVLRRDTIKSTGPLAITRADIYKAITMIDQALNSYWRLNTQSMEETTWKEFFIPAPRPVLKHTIDRFYTYHCGKALDTPSKWQRFDAALEKQRQLIEAGDATPSMTFWESICDKVLQTYYYDKTTNIAAPTYLAYFDARDVWTGSVRTTINAIKAEQRHSSRMTTASHYSSSGNMSAYTPGSLPYQSTEADPTDEQTLFLTVPPHEKEKIKSENYMLDLERHLEEATRNVER